MTIRLLLVRYQYNILYHILTDSYNITFFYVRQIIPFWQAMFKMRYNNDYYPNTFVYSVYNYLMITRNEHHDVLSVGFYVTIFMM